MSEAFPKNMTTKQAVLATLAYFHLFEVPLTRAEISEHLFFLKPDDQKIDIYLKESPLVRQKNGYFTIDAREEFYNEFEQKLMIARKHWKKVRRWQWIFSICPFIRLVCVCNSLPLYAVGEESDIDLLVVTKRNRLFLARFCLTILTTLFGVRRHGSKVRGRFCLSFYISEDDLNLEMLALKPYDIYLAYWIKTLEPVSGEYLVYEKLIEENRAWLESYFQTLSHHRRYFRKMKPLQKRIKMRLERWLDRDEWESKTKKKQLRRAKDKSYSLKDRSGTVISETMLKFHDQDRRAILREAWTNLLNRLL